MTGIPDAVVEAAAIVIAYGTNIPTERRTDYWFDLPRYEQARYLDRARAALEAAEGPWREHLAAQIEAVVPENYAHGYGLRDAARIVRGTNEPS